MEGDPAMLGPGFRSRRRPGDGVELHVVEGGPEDGRPVLLLHGFPDFSWTWRHLAPRLAAAGFHVIAPDLRGYNLSGKPKGIEAYRLDRLVADVMALATGFGFAAFRLVGHDWGGIVAFETALRHPEAVERLVILDAPHPDVLARTMVRHPTQALRSSYAAFFQLPILPEALLAARDHWALRRMLTGASRPGTFGARDLALYGDAFRRPGALTAMLNYYRALRRPRAPPLPRRVGTETLLVWGGRDRTLGRPVFEASRAMLERGRALFLAEAGHWSHLEEPEIVGSALTDFLRDPTPTAG